MTLGDYMDRLAARYGWSVDWKTNTVRMPKRHARYARPVLIVADKVVRFFRLYGNVLWSMVLAVLCLEAAFRSSWHTALLFATLFGAYAERQLNPKPRYL